MHTFPQWYGEACGNTFRIFSAQNTHDGDVASYLENIRANGGWNFDTALLLTESRIASVRMRVFERDGSESMMCGNGLRVVGCILDNYRLPRMVEAGENIIMIQKKAHGIYRIPLSIRCLGVLPLPERANFPRFTVYEVAGEPHAVAVVDNVWTAPLELWGRSIVGPVNCTIVSENDGVVMARTFERGVNDETLSCGTGACAAAQALFERNIRGRSSFMVRMHEYSLGVDFEKDIAWLSGPANAQPFSYTATPW
jgi:diaminopimelate epimerase